jgi:selenocysteine lyase/cysteine desulfurase
MNRRDWLRRNAALLAGAALPEAKLRETDPEAYWGRLRAEQFLLPDWRVFLNNGSLGVAPRPVVDAMTAWIARDASRAPDDYPRWGYETLDTERERMSAFVGCKKDELAFTHNATEALSYIAAGLELKLGDEVLHTDQEHPSGRAPWQRRAQRDGIRVREVKLPMPPESPGQLADLVISAIGPRTRVVMISGIITTTGWMMPVREICDAARAKGILTVVDGAHMNGQVDVRIEDLHCDFFAGSPHKWLFAPGGCGLLYIREEHLDRLWPTTTTGDWDNKELKAARFMKIGTNNKTTIVGMMAGLQFLQDLGPVHVYARIHSLAQRARRMAAERPYIRVLTPPDDRMYGGLVTMEFPGRNMAPLWAKLRERKIWTLVADRLRISTHIHTRPRDLDAYFRTCDEVFA